MAFEYLAIAPAPPVPILPVRLVLIAVAVCASKRRSNSEYRKKKRILRKRYDVCDVRPAGAHRCVVIRFYRVSADFKFALYGFIRRSFGFSGVHIRSLSLE